MSDKIYDSIYSLLSNGADRSEVAKTLDEMLAKASQEISDQKAKEAKKEDLAMAVYNDLCKYYEVVNDAPNLLDDVFETPESFIKWLEANYTTWRVLNKYHLDLKDEKSIDNFLSEFFNVFK